MFYLVGTPIGNIEDSSLRMIKVLTTVDIILSEDTKTFDRFYQRVQRLFNIYPKKKQKIISYYKNKEFEKLPLIVNFLKENKEVALVSESGMPAISDPGRILINQLIKMNQSFTVIPGPTAFINAVVFSGYSTDSILFLGFLPKKHTHLLQLINKLKWIEKTLRGLTVVFYESPHRIHQTLKVLDKLLPKTEFVIAREMTKKFEEIIRGKPAELLNKKLKGEITVVIKLGIKN